MQSTNNEIQFFFFVILVVNTLDRNVNRVHNFIFTKERKEKKRNVIIHVRVATERTACNVCVQLHKSFFLHSMSSNNRNGNTTYYLTFNNTAFNNDEETFTNLHSCQNADETDSRKKKMKFK